MKLSIAILLFLASLSHVFAQQNKLLTVADNAPHYKGGPLDSIRLRLKHGDIQALYDLAPYLDSKKLLFENLGYHVLYTQERVIADRLMDENCIFLPNEYSYTRDTTAKQFLAFLNLHRDKLVFSDDAAAFLITPLVDRDVKYDIRQLSESNKQQLHSEAASLLSGDWIRDAGINDLINNKDPLVLLKIASQLYKRRIRFDDYPDKEQCVKLIELLTGTQIGVEDEAGKINYHANKSYYPATQLNMLIYFAKNYLSYKWSDRLGCFSQANAVAHALSNEDAWFELLNSKTDSVAINAFIHLTTGDKQRVVVLADEYEKADMDKNYALPTFPYRFLKQMVLLTDYCRTTHIAYKKSGDLLQDIETLKNSHLDFVTRRKLEDKLINTLTLSNVTVLEYWSLVYEQNSNLSFSAGRILDVFYSKTWDKMIADTKELEFYLLKTTLYHNLGITGVGYEYIKKFSGMGQPTLLALKRVNATDPYIAVPCKNAMVLATKQLTVEINDKKSNDGNYDAHIDSLEFRYQVILRAAKDSDDKASKIAKLISQIDYTQIGTMIHLLQKYKYKNRWGVMSFLKTDFGFFYKDIDEDETLHEFISHYNGSTQAGLYGYYLNKACISYLNPNKTLNYDKVYNILKYNAVTAFVGGGGGTIDNEVYSIIKLLELHFKTTLGYPAKLCNADEVYGCTSANRAKEWMALLKIKGLLKQAHNQPVSFSYE